MWALEGEIWGLREAIAASGARLKGDLVSIEREAKDGRRRSHEREGQAMADVGNEVGGSWRSSRLLSKETVTGFLRDLKYGARMSS
jgi:hypothetical protein